MVNQFFSWGKDTTADIDAREAQLVTLETHISNMKKELAEVKHEATRSLSEVEQRRAQAQKEEKALNALRKEVRERIALAERKEAHLRRLETHFAVSEKRFREEQVQAEKLRQEQVQLTNSVENLGRTLTERKAATQEAQKILLEARRETSNLAERREELKRIEASLSQLSVREKLLQQDVARKEKRVQDGAHLLESQQQETAQVKATFEQLTAQIEQAQSFLSQLHKDIPVGKRELARVLAQKTSLENQKLEQSLLAKKLADQEKFIGQKMREVERFTSQAAEIERKEQATSAMLEQKKQVLAQLRAANDQNVAASENFKNQEAKVKAATQQLLIAQQERGKRLLEQEKAFVEKNKMLEERAKQVSVAEQAFERKVNSMGLLRAEIETLERRKQEALAVLSEKKQVLNDLKRSTLEQQKTLSQLQSEETEARDAATKLVAAQHEFNKRLKLLEHKEQKFNAREKCIATREESSLTREAAVKEVTHLLMQDKQNLVKEIKSREDAFLALQKEWNERVELLQHEKDDLKHEKADVRKLIEADITELVSKEDELVTTISTLEADKKKLEEEEHALIVRVGEFEKAKVVFDKEKGTLEVLRKSIVDNERMVQKGLKLVETEKRKLEHDRDQIYRSRELKKVLPALEKKYGLLQKGVTKLQLTSVEKAMSLSKRKHMTEREHELEEHERRINIEERKLHARKQEVEDLEEHEQVAFHNYLSAQKIPEQQSERIAQTPRLSREPSSNIHSLIDEARENVEHGNIDDASRIISEAETLVEKVSDPEQRRQLRYDVRDVKASIKLATLL